MGTSISGPSSWKNRVTKVILTWLPVGNSNWSFQATQTPIFHGFVGCSSMVHILEESGVLTWNSLLKLRHPFKQLLGLGSVKESTMTVLNQWVSLSFCLVNHMDYAFVIQAELILGVLASKWSHWNKLHKKEKMKLLSGFYFSFGQSLTLLNDSILKATLKARQKLSQASKLLSNILQWNSIFSQWLFSHHLPFLLPWVLDGVSTYPVVSLICPEIWALQLFQLPNLWSIHVGEVQPKYANIENRQ